MTNGILFIVCGSGSIYLALEILGVFGLVVAWFGVSMFVAGAGFLGVGPSVFGKRPDGRLPWWSCVLHFPYFLLNNVIWQALRWSREDCWNEIVPDLYLGRRAYASELPPDIKLVVDLTSEFSEPREVVDGRTYLCLPTLDGGVPDVAAFRAALAQIVSCPGRVYVHCAFGHGRSALVVTAAVFTKGLAPTLDEARALVKRARPGIGLKRVQRRFLEQALTD